MATATTNWMARPQVSTALPAPQPQQNYGVQDGMYSTSGLIGSYSRPSVTPTYSAPTQGGVLGSVSRGGMAPLTGGSTPAPTYSNLGEASAANPQMATRYGAAPQVAPQPTGTPGGTQQFAGSGGNVAVPGVDNRGIIGGAAGYTAAQLGNAAQWNVDNNQQSGYQMLQMSQQGSPIVAAARGAAMQQAASRGLANSSMAATAGQKAAYEAIQPYALQDASTYADSAKYNTDMTNTFSRENVQYANNALQFSADAANAAARQNSAVAGTLAKTQMETDAERFGYETEYKKGVDVAGINKESSLGVANIGAAADRDVANTNKDASLGVADRNAAASLGVAGINKDASLGVAGINRDASLGVAGINKEASLGVAGLNLQGTLGSARIGADAQIQSSRIGADATLGSARIGANAQIQSSENAMTANIIGHNLQYQGGVVDSYTRLQQQYMDSITKNNNGELSTAGKSIANDWSGGALRNAVTGLKDIMSV
jgi:hypothetical protein